MKITRYHLVLILFLIALISSIILSTKPAPEICDINNGCEIVEYSKYNSVFGISNSYFGIVIFVLIIGLIISYLINPTQNKKAMINLSIIGGSLVALYFLYVQHFILNAYCRYCLIVDFSIIICLILIIPSLKKGFAGLRIKNEENIATRS